MDFNQLTFWFQNLSQLEKILVVLVVLASAYLVYNKLSNSKTKSKNIIKIENNQWLNNTGHMNPVNCLLILTQQFGSPSVFDGQSGGLAQWSKSKLNGTPFEKLELRDELVHHDSPRSHYDFLYTWYKINLSQHKAKNLHQISQGLSYDQMTGEMIVRCFDLRANLVGHWITKQYAEDSLTIDEAVGMYAPMVMELLEDDETGVKYQQLLSEL